MVTRQKISQAFTNHSTSGFNGLYSPVQGCMVLSQTGYEIWNISKKRWVCFKGRRHPCAYFPMLIPESFFNRRRITSTLAKYHVEAAGKVERTFGLRQLLRPLLGMPSPTGSSPIETYSKSIMVTCSVGKKTLPFLRTSGSSWQEGHTAHADGQKPWTVLCVCSKSIRSRGRYASVPVVDSEKTPSERFAGAVSTFSIEAMIPKTVKLFKPGLPLHGD